jgi:formylglycine-generating enzyme required for sulfatase activity
MSEHSPPEHAALSLSEVESIDRICDRFEAAWRADEWPCIEGYLDAVSEPGRTVLLRELLELEVELRLETGERPTVGEYRLRFAERVEVVDDVFRQERESGAVRPTFSEKALEARVSNVDAATSHASTVGWDPERVDDLPEVDGALGRIVGDYQILERIGSGGMGIVYRALHRSARRIVALKLIKADWWGESTVASHREAEQRFRNEAQHHARLEHENIVPVYDVGHADGVLFFSMRLIKGRSLAQMLRSDGPFAPRMAAYHVEAIARAIQYAHDQKVLHRDLKPSNVMVDEHGRPQLIDLGLAKSLEVTEYTTLTGKPLGTPEYMSPEQARGQKEVGFATDVYGLGATLFALLTARPPFTGSSPTAVLRKVIDDEPAWPRERDKPVGRELKAICLKCLEKDPHKRFRSAGALAVALNQYLNGDPIPDIPPSRPWTSAVKWARRQPWRAVAAGVTIVAALAVGSCWAWTTHHARVMADGFVTDLQTIPLSDLRRKIDEMASYRGWVSPRLHELLRSGPADPAFRARLALSLLPSEPGWTNELTERLLACGPEEHRVIREALRSHWPDVAAKLREVFDDPRSDPARRVRAAAALIAMDDPKASSAPLAGPAWLQLGWAENPELRTELLDWLVRSKVDPAILADRFEWEPDPSIRRMLLQGLGGLGKGLPPAGVSEAYRTQLLTLYVDDPDPGIHSSLAYLLRRWGQKDAVKKIDAELAGKPRGGRGWYVNSLLQTMVLLGGPADARWVPREPERIPYRFGIATTETTLRDFWAFDEEHAARRLLYVPRQATDTDAPADVLSFFDAARYCNWLSAKEGIPENQWCYIPGEDEDEEIWLLAPDYLSRRGYRLPTLEEFEYAARAGTTTDRYFGQSEAIVADYAWYQGNTHAHPEPVGQLRPNDFGLFDVIGNLMEWCYNPDPPHEKDCDCGATSGADCQKLRYESLLGAYFGHNNQNQTLRSRGDWFQRAVLPNSHLFHAGFRVVKVEP